MCFTFLVAPICTIGLFLVIPNKMLAYVKMSGKIGSSPGLVQGRHAFYKLTPYHEANTLHILIFPVSTPGR